ncbi:MAG TPA: hypothetical protein VH206_20045 [Xanthobacteraceae bacterium]|jgi:hypothetical protein|nr:hypothetical protein [Xanthobacteraceae bacterium]
MYSLHICTTDDREFPPPELGADVTWDRLTEALRREVGPDAAALLAEPIYDPAHRRTHWHVTADNDPVSLSALPRTERDALLARLGAIRAKVRERTRQLEAAGGETNTRLAAALATIIEVPDEGAHVWSVRGQPVLTAWGRRTGTAARPVATIVSRAMVPHGNAAPAGSAPPASAPVVRAARPERIDGGTASGPFRGGTAVAAATVPEQRRSRFSSVLFWLPFLVLLGAIYYLLLAACALRVPILQSIFNRCDMADASELDGLHARNSALSEAIREAERRLALICSDLARHHASSQPQRENPNTQRTPDTKEAEARVREAQGAHGKFDITLAWNGHQDLDLHIACPGGEISFSTHSICGGTLDIDRNASAPYTDQPVEHASWDEAPPSGHYRVEVKYYDHRDAPEGPVPFTVVIRDGDHEQTYNGTVGEPGQTVVATEFQR